jgi:hypothetical protein
MKFYLSTLTLYSAETGHFFHYEKIMRFKVSPQLLGAERKRAWNQNGSHPPTSLKWPVTPNISAASVCPNVSTTPITAMGFRQCLPLKEGACSLFFCPRTRPKTFLQCFALEQRKYKAKHCRNVLGRVLGRKNKLHALSFSVVQLKDKHCQKPH